MTERRGTLRSDLAKADARGVTPEDLEEIPEVTEEEFARGRLHLAGVPIKRGRPRSPSPKEHVNLRLPPAVLEHFRAKGRGWQTRISEVLEQHVARASAGPKKPRRRKG